MVLSSNKHIECDLLWKVEGAVTLVLRRIPEIKAGGSAKGLCLNFFIHHSLDIRRTITQSNQEFPNYPNINKKGD